MKWVITKEWDGVPESRQLAIGNTFPSVEEARKAIDGLWPLFPGRRFRVFQHGQTYSDIICIQLAERLAKLDGRPYHSKEYLETIWYAGGLCGWKELSRRLTWLEKHPDSYQGFVDLRNLLVNGSPRMEEESCD